MAALPTGSTLLGYLGWAADATLTGQADEHAAGALRLVREYTRGKGFTTAEDGTVTVLPGIASVVVTYGSRSLSNPTSARELEARGLTPTNELPRGASNLLEATASRGTKLLGWVALSGSPSGSKLPVS